MNEINEKTIHYCDRGCGHIAHFYSKQYDTWRCSKNVKQCPAERERVKNTSLNLYKSGYINPMKGKHHTEKEKENLRIVGKKRYENGYIHPMLGKHHTEETKNKIGIGNKGKTQTEEAKHKISVANTGRIFTLEHREKLGDWQRHKHININGVEYKQCSICKENKILDEFYNSENHWDNKTTICKLCYYDYQQEHKNERSIHFKNRRKIDIQFKLLSNLRGRILQALKGKTKFAHTEELLGCSIEDVKLYIESLFEPDMTWNDFLEGRLQLHHLQPCYTFDMTDPEQQKECFNFSNLYPVWKEDHEFYKKELHKERVS